DKGTKNPDSILQRGIVAGQFHVGNFDRSVLFAAAAVHPSRSHNPPHRYRTFACNIAETLIISPPDGSTFASLAGYTPKGNVTYDSDRLGHCSGPTEWAGLSFRIPKKLACLRSL